MPTSKRLDILAAHLRDVASSAALLEVTLPAGRTRDVAELTVLASNFSAQRLENEAAVLRRAGD
jgi:hypothetical protein